MPTAPRILALLAGASVLFSQDAKEVKEALDKLAQITGISILKPVAQRTMKRDELKKYFETRIQEVVKPEEIRIEQLALYKFGFVPRDFDLKKATVDLMAEQAAAFYDYRKNQMVLLDSTGGGLMQDMALVHELAHALADQHFHLERFLKKGNSGDDSAMARTAVMEGQATYLMSEYMALQRGQSLKDTPGAVEAMARMAGAGGSGFPVFESTPLYMRESLVFPYAKGMLFQHRVIEKRGQAGYRDVFLRAPDTTREILHPEAYFDEWKPAAPKLPRLASTRGWKKQAEGTVGEFDHEILIRQYAKDRDGLAAAWRGGRYELWEQKKDKRAVLIYGSVWEDEAKAREFFDAYRTVLEGKLPKATFTSEDAAARRGSSADGEFTVWLAGREVRSIEGYGSGDEIRAPQ